MNPFGRTKLTLHNSVLRSCLKNCSETALIFNSQENNKMLHMAILKAKAQACVNSKSTDQVILNISLP